MVKMRTREDMIKKLRSDRCSTCKFVKKGFWVASSFICVDCLDEMFKSKPKDKEGRPKKNKETAVNNIRNF